MFVPITTYVYIDVCTYYSLGIKTFFIYLDLSGNETDKKQPALVCFAQTRLGDVC